MNYRIIILLSIIFFYVPKVLSQTQDSCEYVLLLKKGQKLKLKDDMASVNNTGFYLFKNCLYYFSLKSGALICGRITQVKKDTIEFATYSDKKILPTDDLDFRPKIKIHYNQIEKFWLISDRSMGLYNYANADKYDFIFQKDISCPTFPIKKAKVYQNKDVFYEILPLLTTQGLDLMYEHEGKLYAFWGEGADIKEEKTPKTYQIQQGVYFTPSYANEINGLNIGLLSRNLDGQSLKIDGISLELNIFSLPTVLLGAFQQKDIFKDSTHFADETTENATYIRGLNISVSGTNGCGDINGVNIAGLITSVHNLEGFSLSGLCNFSDKMKGLSVAGIQNYANECKGVQIGLFNRSKKLRGIQIGLWNVNERRSLPFINWQFRDKKTKNEKK